MDHALVCDGIGVGGSEREEPAQMLSKSSYRCAHVFDLSLKWSISAPKKKREKRRKEKREKKKRKERKTLDWAHHWIASTPHPISPETTQSALHGARGIV